MKLIRNSLLVISCLILSGCDDTFKGVLRLQQQVILKMKKSELAVPAGNYNAEIKASSSKVKLKLTLNSTEHKIEFALPKGKKIRSFNDVDISPAASGQAYRLKGNEVTDVSNTGSVDSTESCTYYTTENQCGWVDEPEFCDSEGICHGGGTEYICQDVQVGHSGTQSVTYYDTVYTTDRSIQLLDPNSQQTIGTFSNRSQK